jgi:hypothetical protein
VIFLRIGAFLFNIDENLENPGTFRTEMLIRSWAEHLQQLARMTKSESEASPRVGDACRRANAGRASLSQAYGQAIAGQVN